MKKVNEKAADLHIHTTASDGTDKLKKRIKDAEKQGLDAIAVTDHDAINPNLEKRSFTAQNGVEVITGAEINSEIDGVKIEILGYFLDPKDKKLCKTIEKNKEYRKKRMKEMVQRLNNDIGPKINYVDVRARADGNVGRPHLAAELVEKGVVDTRNQAFNEYISEDCEAYVQTERVEAEKIITKIHENGGAAVLAHPGRDLEKDEAENVINKLSELGLDGLEVEYTYRHKIRDGYNIKFTEVYAARLAEREGLIRTGGSDCHGSKSNKYNIGKVKLDYGCVEKLRRTAESYRN